MILDNYEQFLDSLLKNVATQGIDVSDLEMDHIAYQASSKEDYESLKPEFDKISELIREFVVGGRHVSVYMLNTPLTFRNYIIRAIELIEPKEGVINPSALEHAEFVIKEDFDSFMKKYPNLDWDTSSKDRVDYAHLKLKLTDQTQVKFHRKNIWE